MSTKTKSTGKPAKSTRYRKQRLKRPREQVGLDVTQEWMQLPESGDLTGPPLKVKPKPRPPSPGEQKILDLLWGEFERSDDVARAAARFETDVHEQLVQRRIDEGFSEDEAGEVRRIFRAEELNDTFRRLLLLRLERALLIDLELQDYEANILQERIHTLFGTPAPKATKSISLSGDKVQIGSSEVQQVQNLKARGRRRQRKG
ncbi:hypothetical protein LCGC14_0607940 [marine sediment metagenome]|uniref:Uncharacterized protein n=1 Tax=marine sediment metagenome TaxID=412755 RepID=A0A0F9UH21_9ZZZZ